MRVRYAAASLSTLVVVLALSGMAAASASAEVFTEWRLNGKTVTEPVSVNIEGHIKLVDAHGGGGFGGANEVTCSAANKGTVGSKGTGSVTESSLTKCAGGGVCAGTSPVTKVSHLPWLTKPSLYAKESLVNELEAGSAGLPEWEWECHSVYGTIKDTCTLKHAWAALTNTSELGVGIVDEKWGSGGPLPNILTCTVGHEDGEMTGEDHIKAANGGNLTAA